MIVRDKSELGGNYAASRYFDEAATGWATEPCNWPVHTFGGPPRDIDAADRRPARGLLRQASTTSTPAIFTAPHVTNQIIKQALHPYPEGRVIVTKVGARRPEDKSWVHALSRQELIDAVHDNLRNPASTPLM